MIHFSTCCKMSTCCTRCGFILGDEFFREQDNGVCCDCKMSMLHTVADAECWSMIRRYPQSHTFYSKKLEKIYKKMDEIEEYVKGMLERKEKQD